MSNVEIILKMYKAFFEKDEQTLNSICHPNIKWIQNPGFPGGGISTGVKEIISNVFVGNNSRWDYFSFQRDNIFSCNEKVVVEGHYKVRAKKEGETIDVQACHVYEVYENLITSFQQYTDTKTLWDQLK